MQRRQAEGLDENDFSDAPPRERNRHHGEQQGGGTSVNASNGDTQMPRAIAKQSTMATRPRWFQLLHNNILIVVTALPKSV